MQGGVGAEDGGDGGEGSPDGGGTKLSSQGSYFIDSNDPIKVETVL